MNSFFYKKIRPLSPIKTVLEYQIKSIQGVNKKDIAKWMSNEFENLGPVYIKLGQFFSSREDIFGEEFTNEFKSLRDDVFKIKKEELIDVINDLKVRKVIIETNPLASASIAQVHKGYVNGRTVAVKIKRPNIDVDIKNNIDFLTNVLLLARKVSKSDDAYLYEIEDVLNEFTNSILRETDFTNEIENLKTFKKLYRNMDNVYIPRVFTNYSNRDVIVMEYIPSKPLSSFRGNKTELSRTICKIFIEQLINSGTIHGDPHSGNVGLVKNDKLVLYDMGNILTISKKETLLFKELIYYLLISNKSAIITTLKKLNVKIDDEAKMMVYIDIYIDYMKTLDISVFKVFKDERNMPFKPTGNVFKLIRVFGIIEGLCKNLDPDFNYFTVLQNYITYFLLDEEFLLYKSRSDINLFMQRLNVNI